MVAWNFEVSLEEYFVCVLMRLLFFVFVFM